MRQFVAAALVIASAVTALSGNNPKHEFRGAWMHIIGQGQYAAMNGIETQKYLVRQLDSLQLAGCNAIIWQIRPQADAAYPSQIEPWSRWLTGTPGKAPSPRWDPLDFMIIESHKRGMELHAWINPYRVTSSKTDEPAKGHIYYEHPEWFIRYADGKLYFDPGLPESRDFINKVVVDILNRYDVDAIHMDDYFYPYPVKGAEFGDSASYARYGAGMNRDDWRRHNVDLLIEQLHRTIGSVKPWVRLGISPFGIWRNKSSDPDGSDTHGLECYDALYADCPLWTKKGWVDYMVPQLYWELESKAASDLVLSYWWNDHANGRHMYYGQAVRRTMDKHDIGESTNPTQLDHKWQLMRELPNVHGVTWWPAYDVTGNYKGVCDSLIANRQSTPAIVPAYTWLDSICPDEVATLKADRRNGKVALTWTPTETSDPMQQAVRYVVYAFDAKASINLEDADAIVAVTGLTRYEIDAKRYAGKKVWVVTTLDRSNNESKVGKKLTLKL